jgi:hypothetical protein
VAQTDAEPPNHGRIDLAKSGSIRKRRNEPRKTVPAKRIRHHTGAAPFFDGICGSISLKLRLPKSVATVDVFGRLKSKLA